MKFRSFIRAKLIENIRNILGTDIMQAWKRSFGQSFQQRVYLKFPLDTRKNNVDKLTTSQFLWNSSVLFIDTF